MKEQTQLIMQPLDRQRPKKLGELLLNSQTINEDQLKLALAEQKRLNESSQRKFKIGEILLFLNLIKMNQLHANLLIQRPRTPDQREQLTKIREIKSKSWDDWMAKLRKK